MGWAPSTVLATGPPRAAASADPSAVPLAYDPAGSADANRAWCDQQTGPLTAGDLPAPDTVAQTQTGAGLDPLTIEVSSPATSTGSLADAVFWAVQVNEECLIGQYSKRTTLGPSRAYTSMVASHLSDDPCLIG